MTRRTVERWRASAAGAVFGAALCSGLAPRLAAADQFTVDNCLDGKVFSGDSLCYPRCAPGYQGIAEVCWGSCPAGTHDDGALCRRDANVIGADNSGCPWYDKCGLTFSRGCSTCPDGYHNDGCTCRVDVLITPKPSYGRGAGETPFRVCNSTSFTNAVPARTTTPEDFTVVFMADPQPPRSRAGSNDPDTSSRVNAEQVQAVNDVVHANGGRWDSSGLLTRGGGDPITNPTAVVIAGDLTEYWHDSEVDTFMSYWGHTADPSSVPNVAFPVYLGLGNHDCSNNVGDCGWPARGGGGDGKNGCAKNAVGFMKAMMSCNMVPNFPASTVQSYDTASLAYSWNIGRYHFVMLNNFPTYERSAIGVSSALGWLRTNLAAATAAGKHSVLVFHDPDEHWRDFGRESFGEFRNVVAANDVVAVFVGHYHDYLGRADAAGPLELEGAHAGQEISVALRVLDQDKRERYPVPLFFSGNPIYNTFLLVRFTGSFINVAAMDSTGGAPKFKCPDKAACMQTITIAPTTNASVANQLQARPAKQVRTRRAPVRQR